MRRAHSRSLRSCAGASDERPLSANAASSHAPTSGSGGRASRAPLPGVCGISVGRPGSAPQVWPWRRAPPASALPSPSRRWAAARRMLPRTRALQRPLASSHRRRRRRRRLHESPTAPARVRGGAGRDEGVAPAARRTGGASSVHAAASASRFPALERSPAVDSMEQRRRCSREAASQEDAASAPGVEGLAFPLLGADDASRFVSARSPRAPRAPPAPSHRAARAPRVRRDGRPSSAAPPHIPPPAPRPRRWAPQAPKDRPRRRVAASAGISPCRARPSLRSTRPPFAGSPQWRR